MKSKTTAGILAILLGGIGIHKFYLGRTLWGIIYILFCWTLIPSIVGFIEGLIYLCSSDQEFNAKYNPEYLTNNSSSNFMAPPSGYNNQGYPQQNGYPQQSQSNGYPQQPQANGFMQQQNGQQNSRYCPNCGAENKPNANFCVECGNKL